MSATPSSPSAYQPSARLRRAFRPNSYRCLSRDGYEYGDYALQALQRDQLELIRQWRNSQRHILRQRTPISVEQQRAYYNDTIAPRFDLSQPDLILLSFSLDDVYCGYAGLTNIDWEARRSEISFLADPQRVVDAELYERDFSACLHLLKEIAFSDLGLERLFAETFDVRPGHIAVLEQCGFEFEGRMRGHAVVDDQRTDSLIHGCLREDWRAAG